MSRAIGGRACSCSSWLVSPRHGRRLSGRARHRHAAAWRASRPRPAPAYCPTSRAGQRQPRPSTRRRTACRPARWGQRPAARRLPQARTGRERSRSKRKETGWSQSGSCSRTPLTHGDCPSWTVPILRLLKGTVHEGQSPDLSHVPWCVARAAPFVIRTVGGPAIPPGNGAPPTLCGTARRSES